MATSRTPSPAPAAAPAPAVAAKTAPTPARKRARPAPAKTAAKPAARAAKPVAAAPAPEAKDTKAKKPKLVRDSFTIPKDEYAAIEELKQRAAKLARTAKKSELLRAGLKLLAGLADDALLKALQAVPSIKTGRPNKAESARK